LQYFCGGRSATVRRLEMALAARETLTVNHPLRNWAGSASMVSSWITMKADHMPILISAEPMTREEIEEIGRKWREQQARDKVEMRQFYPKSSWWQRLLRMGPARRAAYTFRTPVSGQSHDQG
jgi:hypothetical protein